MSREKLLVMLALLGRLAVGGDVDDLSRVVTETVRLSTSNNDDNSLISWLNQ